jgi:hypothetical protein
MQQERPSGRLQIPWPQLSLLDVMILVLVAGLSLGLARGAKLLLHTGSIINDSTTGVVTMVLAVWLCAPLARQALASSRTEGRIKTKLWPVAWRMAMVVGLAWSALREGVILRLRMDQSDWFPVQFPPVYKVPIKIRLSVLPILLGFALVGVVCSLLPLKIRMVPSRRWIPLQWLMIPLVAVVGLLMAATQGHVTYLVLVAVEGVTNALNSRSGQTLPDVFMRRAPSLNARLARTSWEVMASVVACVVTGIMVSRDLRRDLSDEPLTYRQFLLRMLAACATGYMGLRLVLVTTPMMHPSFYEGLIKVFERSDLVVFVGAFSLFGIGMAARAVAPRIPSPLRPRWYRWIGLSVGTLFVPILGFLTVSMYAVLIPAEPGLSPRLAAFVEWIRAFYTQLTSAYPIVGEITGLLWLNTLCWTLVTGWLLAKVVVMNIRKPGSTIAPLDQIGATRARLGWFAWCSTGVTAVCLAALPTFALGGIVVFHCRIHADKFFGWKLP